MLLTRSPLSPAPKGRFSLDLHVLGAPPAFVLSQDQTLREEVLSRPPEGGLDSCFEDELEAQSVCLPRKARRVLRASCAEAREVLDVHAVEFSKTAPPRQPATKKASDSQEALREVIPVVSASSEGFSLAEGPLFAASLLASRRMIATTTAVSRIRRADENSCKSALSGL